MGATLPERRHELAVPYLPERPYQSGNTSSLAIFASERPPRATGRSRSSSRATSPQRHPEVARGCVDLRSTYKPGATSHSDYLRSLPAPRATSRSDVPRSLRVVYLMDSTSFDDQNAKCLTIKFREKKLQNLLLLEKKRKETEISSSDLPPKPRKKIAHRAKCWEHFIQREDDPSQCNCRYCGVEIGNA
ncbi:hypothetical protein F2Q70_00029448 [Brassica cretica]|uniref:Uncharacterized protein n=1 Tax=Brassica cretica TaxID=69181 RepID=A0A8S9FNF2_BRACR|nr:hypothetical protein F2Q70_00029448 [Brassica cretica]